MSLVFWYIIFFVFTVANNLTTVSAGLSDEDESEPPFPSIYLQSGTSKLNIHIVSENVRDSNYRYTTHEYVNAEGGQEFAVTHNQHGEVSTFIDGTKDLIYRYQPFTCSRSTSADMILPSLGFRGHWVHEYVFEHGDYNLKTLPVFGVTAIWMNAVGANKVFTKAERIYSAIKDRIVSSYRWTMSDDDLRMDIHLYFRVPSKPDDIHKMPLELVQFQDQNTKEIVHTINIMSVKFYFTEEEEAKFSVPAGYGCPTPDLDEHILKHYSLLDDNYKIDMEVSATVFDYSQAEPIKKTDTLSVQIGKAFVYDTHGGDNKQVSEFKEQLLLLNAKGYVNSNADRKYITDIKTGVKYTINKNSNECDITKLADDQINQTPIKFSNDILLEMNQNTLEEILEDITNFNYISKYRQPFDDIYTITFERTGSNLVSKPSSIVRYYQKTSSIEPRLSGVQMYIYNKERTKIETVYNFKILDHVRLTSKQEMAELFDISDCYQDQKSHAWINVKYPVSAKLGEILSRDIYNLKDYFYERYSFNLRLDFIRMPYLEITFDSFFMIVRIKLVDGPSKLYQYAMQKNKDFLMVADDRLEIASNEQQCNELCKLYSCQTFSFCQTYACKITSRDIALTTTTTTTNNNNDIAILVNDDKCTLYSKTTDNSMAKKNSDDEAMSLQEILSQLQHDNYGDYSLPPSPEELLQGPNGENYSDKEARSNAISDYAAQVALYMYKYDTPAMTLLLELENILVILTPSEFLIEKDPMAELFPSDSDEDSLLPYVPKFYHAIMERRFKMALDKRSLVLSDQTYEQCSLLCVDRNCLSLSYCQFEKQCIVTDFEDSAAIMTNSLSDSGCFIAQRDFLTKFTKFENVGRPIRYKAEREALSASHCAHLCVSEKQFRCLSFDYCSSPTKNEKTDSKPKGSAINYLPSCLLHEARDRDMDYGSLAGKLQKNGRIINSKVASSKKQPKMTGCDHYGRSILADFQQLESRQFKETTFYEAQLEVLTGIDLEECAQICIEEHADCSTLEFCYFSRLSSTQKQSCIIANGKIFNGVTNTATDISNMFNANVECSIYSLRKDALIGSYRDSFINLGGDNRTGKDDEQAVPMSHSGFAYLLIFGFIISLLIGVGIVIGPKYREPIQKRIDRLIDMRRTHI